MIFRRLLRDQRAAAAGELALALPLLIVLIWAPFELGNYFLDEHMLIKGVRDGAVYAAHQDMTNYDCSAGTPTVPQTMKDNIQAVVRTGQVSGGVDRLRNWGSATFDVTLTCTTQSTGGTALGGIYALNSGGKVPIITITAIVPYASILGIVGIRNSSSLSLNATQQATAIGI